MFQEEREQFVPRLRGGSRPAELEGQRVGEVRGARAAVEVFLGNGRLHQGVDTARPRKALWPSRRALPGSVMPRFLKSHSAKDRAGGAGVCGKPDGAQRGGQCRRQRESRWAWTGGAHLEMAGLPRYFKGGRTRRGEESRITPSGAFFLACAIGRMWRVGWEGRGLWEMVEFSSAVDTKYGMSVSGSP